MDDELCCAGSVLAMVRGCESAGDAKSTGLGEDKKRRSVIKVKLYLDRQSSCGHYLRWFSFAVKSYAALLAGGPHWRFQQAHTGFHTTEDRVNSARYSCAVSLLTNSFYADVLRGESKNQPQQAQLESS